MSKLHLSTLLIALFLFTITNSLVAQSEFQKNSISAKKLWIDYRTPIEKEISEFPDLYTDGFEIGYTHSFNKAIKLNIPFKIGVVSPVMPNGAYRSEDPLMFGLGANLMAAAFSEKCISPYLLAGAAGVKVDDEDIEAQFPVGIGFNIKLMDGLYLQLQSEYRFSLEDNRDNLHHGIGVMISMGETKEPEPKELPPPDRDNDGITDSNDDCPDVPGPAVLGGCPDGDGDGVADKNDDCPEVAGMPQYKGCPDTDNDGLADNVDKCPDQAGPVSNEGCPVSDMDGDGIADAEDDCPNDVGSAQLNGCPDVDNDGIADKDDDCPKIAGVAKFRGCPDTDGDGVPDPSDKCPNTAGPASNSGCPVIEQKEKEVLEFAMSAVEFESGRATLRSQSYSVLDQIVEILKKYPDYSMKVEGHTDSIGDVESNQILSERRAKACMDYIISKGISPSRISSKGYGESNPIADNRYKEGRQKNRRVEFNIYLK